MWRTHGPLNVVRGEINSVGRQRVQNCAPVLRKIADNNCKDFNCVCVCVCVCACVVDAFEEVSIKVRGRLEPLNHPVIHSLTSTDSGQAMNPKDTQAQRLPP